MSSVTDIGLPILVKLVLFVRRLNSAVVFLCCPVFFCYACMLDLVVLYLVFICNGFNLYFCVSFFWFCVL